MAKNRYSIKDLEAMGLTLQEDGTYARVIEGKKYVRKDPTSLYTMKDITERNPAEIAISNEVKISPPLASVLTIPGLIAGLNGDKGLMRAHWSHVKKQKEFYCKIIQGHLRENKVRKHLGEVTVEYIGYKSSFMDWDNFCSSFKHIGDSLVEMKIIMEDKPKIITQFIPSQIKCKREDQKVVVIIKDK
jgi:hypothetical protein